MYTQVCVDHACSVPNLGGSGAPTRAASPFEHAPLFARSAVSVQAKNLLHQRRRKDPRLTFHVPVQTRAPCTITAEIKLHTPTKKKKSDGDASITAVIVPYMQQQFNRTKAYQNFTEVIRTH